MQSRLREILKKQGRSQKWLAEQVVVNKSTISDLVKGAHDPSLLVASRIAKALGVKIEDIWFE
ncbi:helix-turn-helix transcriptional regulator [Bacillus sp. T33-2]|uniref:helix-turn-helix transcriptional regulator n=1 Tax=Bacillus sp. T33-2 TaxID=2054168 RepID=UPI0015E134AA|nr:helix-turn-helix transcriptional regulator [Bacillus sp. T33-2]